MSKKAIIVLAEGFEEIEAITVIDILRRAGIGVVVAGLSDKKVTGSHKITVLVDKLLNETDYDFDICIFPGGMQGAINLHNSENIQRLIQKMHSDKKLISAICASPAIVLSPTGILKDKSTTCYPGLQDKFEKETTYKEDDVVIDKNIITSRGPGTALSFSLAIVEKLVGKKVRDKVEEDILFTAGSSR
jgi:4-methyl-5(b-hydroxyethyl)-thiazole monophosphate biosynthesis